MNPLDERPYSFINTDDALLRFCESELWNIDGAPVGVDIEEDREHGYNPLVALVQITVEDRDYVIDPLALSHEVLDPLIESLCLTPSLVVMHGCNNDVSGLKRDFGVGPAHVADTQIAARFLGRESFGLAALLHDAFGLHMSKEQRRSNWLNRPLSTQQLDYARDDTRYLLPLWDLLSREVAEQGWGDALKEECDALAGLPGEHHALDPFGWRSLKGTRQLSEDAQYRAAALWAWRDQAARRLNRHPSAVLPPWALLHLAREGVSVLGGSHRAQPKGASDQELEALERLLAEPPRCELAPPRTPRNPLRKPGTGFDRRLEALLEWRRNLAESTGLDAGFLAPRSVLESIAEIRATEPSDYAASPEIRPWRIRRWADDWLALV